MSSIVQSRTPLFLSGTPALWFSGARSTGQGGAERGRVVCEQRWLHEVILELSRLLLEWSQECLEVPPISPFPFSSPLPFPPSSEGSPYSEQVGLELLGSNNPPASASHIIKIVGSRHCTLNVYDVLRQKNRLGVGGARL